MYTIFYNVVTRSKVIATLKRGLESVTEIASKLGEYKSLVWYHLQQLKEKSAVIKVGSNYYLKRKVLSNARKFRQKLKDFKEKLRKSLAYKPKLGNILEMFSDYQQQRLEISELGIQVPAELNLDLLDLIKMKRRTCKNAIEKRSVQESRKFEQAKEFQRLTRGLERNFSLEVPSGLKSIPCSNPQGRKRIQKALN